MSKRRMGGGGSRGRKIGPMLASGKMGRDPKDRDEDAPEFMAPKAPVNMKKGGKVKSRRAGLARRRR